ncbi:MAG: helix-turn-helix domain-containing protein [Candidatus Jorgensenbacteria bacterium]
MNRSEPITPETRALANLIVDGLRMKGVSLERLSQLTGISDRFLELLVGEHYHKLPAAPYMRGYLVKIAEVLGLDGEELWRRYLAESAAVRRAGESDTFPPNRFAIPRFNWKMVLWVLLGVLILGYVLFRIPAFVDSYEFSVNITEGMVVQESAFTIKGTVNENDQLTLNGEVLYPYSNGAFEKLVTLKDGWNTFEFRVKRLLGAGKTFTKQIFYQMTTSTLPTGQASATSTE